MTQLALDLGRRAKERGIGFVELSDAEWIGMALHDLVQFIRARGEASVEMWRFDWLTRGLPEPRTSKSYGALTNIAARRRLIEHTGRYVKAVAERTHSHPVAIWTATTWRDSA